jgi:hypothetical protein
MAEGAEEDYQQREIQTATEEVGPQRYSGTLLTYIAFQVQC